MKPILPNRQQLLASIRETDKNRLYRHFEGAANPDELIYQAWLWANGWICDPDVVLDWVSDPSTGETIMLEVLDLDKPELSLKIIYDFWNMEVILPLLKENF